MYPLQKFVRGLFVLVLMSTEYNLEYFVVVCSKCLTNHWRICWLVRKHNKTKNQNLSQNKL